ncbi:MAG: caspase family protein [Streptosporangiaceae bacterium]
MTGARSALIVACDGYADAGLGRLRAPASDARALAGVLENPAIGGFDVRTLLNAPAYEVALAIEEFFADRVADDLLLLHLSCHGVKDEDGELYFAMANTALRRLAATGVAAEFVNRRMTRSRSRRVGLLLDCCYAGAFERGMTARAGAGVGIESQFGGRGRAVITASSAMEYAFEGDKLADSNELAPSVFTSALVEGLESGDADRDQDGVVSLDELYDYIYDKVRATTPNQTPGKWAFGVQGELVIARRALPVRQPAPLPAEVQEAIDSPLAAVRNAAVQELSRLLRGKHAGRVLAARQALEELTSDDSRTVAAAAAEALGGKKPSPAEVEPAEVEPPEDEPAEVEPAESILVAAPEPVPEPEPGPEPEPEPAPRSEPETPEPTSTSRSEPEPTQQEAEPARQPSSEIAQPVAAPAPQEPTSPGRVGDGLLVAGGLVAIAGAILLLISVFLPFLGSTPLSTYAANTSENVISAVAAAVAGIFLVVPASRQLIGPGFLFGAIATAPSGGIYSVLVGRHFASYGMGTGLWLNVLACAILTIAGAIVWPALVRQRVVHAGRRTPAGIIPWLIVLVGCAGAVLLVAQAFHQDVLAGTTEKIISTDYFALFWTAIMALLLPAVAVITLPRKFGVALLAGWLTTGISEGLFYTSATHSLFILTLVVMVGLTIAYSRQQSAVVSEPTSELV